MASQRLSDPLSRCLIMVLAETGDVYAGAHRYFWPPTKFFQDRVGFPVDRVSDNFTQHWRKFKSMSAVTGGNH